MNMNDNINIFLNQNLNQYICINKVKIQTESLYSFGLHTHTYMSSQFLQQAILNTEYTFALVKVRFKDLDQVTIKNITFEYIQ